ncbi:hypothetical protein ABB26_08730 [Stenotrophomonas humi]|uniref:Uncharacterized protein n=1 Tax=Stenotrophomonas humi TaxID=405444 RepID=A0A0R0C4C5_9GAMM|nr:hypothetical protein ABB26_18325 [Stenotrophomonas humi]KRG64256.1 hypothetical protein ABB26_08730 [Stenotrophomonas humi]
MSRAHRFDGSAPINAAGVEQLVRVEAYFPDNCFVLFAGLFKLAQRGFNLSLLRRRRCKRSFQCRDLSSGIPFDQAHSN